MSRGEVNEPGDGGSEPSATLPGTAAVVPPASAVDGEVRTRSVGVMPRLDLGVLDPELADRVADLVEQSVPASTRRAYGADLRCWAAWCVERGLCPVPADPAAVAGYLVDLDARGLKLSTLERRVSAIGVAHRAVGFDSPRRHLMVSRVLRGLRQRADGDVTRKAPVRLEELRAILEHLRPGPIGLRDRVLLLVGFAGALRRSELVAIDVEHLTHTSEGLVLLVPRSKTDQAGAGHLLGLPHGQHAETCPVTAVADWLDATGIQTGPLLRSVDRHGNIGTERLSDRAVATVVQDGAARAGLPRPERFGGHSLRAGFATTAAAVASEREIQRVTRHASLTTLRSYVRPETVFEDSAVTAVGL